ncbi:hypothetical protein C0V72_12480 [Porphyrobacter sp. TH134]|uniref:hypothetical protein n=1 Tax=Porphyrobacter sp. TH134 TaxID=2067450 RepID=UPI000C7C4752|nr:hypothetical protein [Porphyrobacter sp. TH134]PLK22882.1 hypothetical protein C0V72_12480 [Porphyrobacter sp. TH134]
MRLFACALAIAAPLALAACGGGAGGGKPNSRQLAVINRALATAPGAAQPSTIVAAELAFSRAARERGQWTAFRQFAAPGALLHGKDGPFAIEPWLATQTDPAEAVQWEPRVIAMSCDGAVAVSKGRYRDPQGKVGSFVTVWERQSDNTYRYIFDVGGDDVPQPPPRKAVEEGDIVVTEIDAVQGMVATCPRGGPGTTPPPPAMPIGEDGKADARLSRDGTLRWRWEHRADGTRYIAADYFDQGRWVTAIEQSLAATGD